MTERELEKRIYKPGAVDNPYRDFPKYCQAYGCCDMMHYSDREECANCGWSPNGKKGLELFAKSP